MMAGANLGVVIVASLALIVTPGPDMLYVLATIDEVREAIDRGERE